MPPSDFQTKVLKLLADQRTPQSHVAGGLALNLAFARYSIDIDIFHDVASEVAEAAERDAEVLSAAGLTVTWLKEARTFRSARVTGPEGETVLDWAMDSEFRFFPTEPDSLLGWRLHPFDLATNKALAAAARREPRDTVDLLTIHDNLYPLGAVVWAAVAKDPGYTPLSLLDMIGRFARYRDEDLARVRLGVAIGAAEMSQRIKAAIEDAARFVEAMPSDRAGLMFLKDGQVVQPDPAHLDDYIAQDATRRGVLPVIIDP